MCRAPFDGCLLDVERICLNYDLVVPLVCVTHPELVYLSVCKLCSDTWRISYVLSGVRLCGYVFRKLCVNEGILMCVKLRRDSWVCRLLLCKCVCLL